MSDELNVKEQLTEGAKNDKQSNSDGVVKIIYKRPEYLLETQRKHYNKNKNNPEFMEKQRARVQKYRDANRERVNELARLRRRKKKAEKEAAAAAVAKKAAEDRNSGKI